MQLVTIKNREWGADSDLPPDNQNEKEYARAADKKNEHHRRRELHTSALPTTHEFQFNTVSLDQGRHATTQQQNGVAATGEKWFGLEVLNEGRSSLVAFGDYGGCEVANVVSRVEFDGVCGDAEVDLGVGLGVVAWYSGEERWRDVEQTPGDSKQIFLCGFGVEVLKELCSSAVA